MGIDQDALAAHLQGLRKARSLTLADLASQSGISRATLSRIETAEVSPTAQTLGRLAACYGLPISRLLTPLERDVPPVVRHHAQPVWRDAQHGFTRRSVSPPGGPFAGEVIDATLSPNQDIAYDGPVAAGQEHHLYLLSGGLRVTVDGTEHSLNAGDCLRYKLHGPTRFQTDDAAAHYLMVLI